MKNIFKHSEEEITYNCFLACMTSCCICIILFALITLQVNHKINKNTTDLLNMLAAYLATATDDEYNEIAQQIRHDLILHTDAKRLAQYIPNTAEDCPTCQSDYPGQVYLAALNTGELYSMDSETPQPDGTISFSGGYDEISQTSLNIAYGFSPDYDLADLRQKYDTISLHRMKTIFCDDCIDKILAAIEGQRLTSFVIFIPQEQAIYPISEDTKIQSINHTLSIYFDNESKEMKILYSH